MLHVTTGFWRGSCWLKELSGSRRKLFFSSSMKPTLEMLQLAQSWRWSSASASLTASLLQHLSSMKLTPLHWWLFLLLCYVALFWVDDTCVCLGANGAAGGSGTRMLQAEEGTKGAETHSDTQKNDFLCRSVRYQKKKKKTHTHTYTHKTHSLNVTV